MRRPRSDRRTLLALLLVYAAATVVHFAHNAVFVADYPNLPRSWSSGTVYVAWTVVTAVGAAGWLLLSRGHELAGLLVLLLYAALGLDSLGHYVLAPISAHTLAMNSTILVEVTAAALVAVEVTRQLLRLALRARP